MAMWEKKGASGVLGELVKGPRLLGGARRGE